MRVRAESMLALAILLLTLLAGSCESGREADQEAEPPGRQVGESDLYKPENSVRAGLKYLRWLHSKFEGQGISPENKVWFTLAAYNAGLGHVYDAQDLAEEKGWDRQQWFGHVEKAMLLLSEQKYYERARYGYARGREPVNYVRRIAARYRSFVSLLEAFERQRQVSVLSCGYLPPWLTSKLVECGDQGLASGTTARH